MSFERTVATTLNAYVMPRVSRYIASLGEALDFLEQEDVGRLGDGDGDDAVAAVTLGIARAAKREGNATTEGLVAVKVEDSAAGQVATMPLVPQVVDAVGDRVPVVAAGGMIVEVLPGPTPALSKLRVMRQELLDRYGDNEMLAVAEFLWQYTESSTRLDASMSYAVNGASYRGQQAAGGSVMYRLNTAKPFAVTGVVRQPRLRGRCRCCRCGKRRPPRRP